MNERLKKYLEWVELDNIGKKTKRWHLLALKGPVGEIKWHGAWRKYCFFPFAETLFDWECMRMIAEFCEIETKKQLGKL